MKEYQVPVVLEFILERVTNISMGTEIDKITEFEDLAEQHEDAPTAIVAARTDLRVKKRKNAAFFSQSVDALWRA